MGEGERERGKKESAARSYFGTSLPNTAIVKFISILEMRLAAEAIKRF
jgi:hypothetical protein